MGTATLKNLQRGLEKVSGVRQEIEKVEPIIAQGAQTRPDRAGKTLIGGWFPRSFTSSLRLIQAKHTEKDLQSLIGEALNDLFAKYNVPTIER